MNDLTRNIADILYGPEFSHRDLPPKTPTPSTPAGRPQFLAQDPHGDDIQARGDERRDLFDIFSGLAGLPTPPKYDDLPRPQWPDEDEIC